MKKLKFIVLSLVCLNSCGGKNMNNSSSANTMVSENSESPNSDTSAKITNSDVVDYGTVIFPKIQLFDKGYDKVLIRPYFSKPQICNNEVFTYEIKDETKCYLNDNNQLVFLSAGNTTIKAKSEHFESTFTVECKSDFKVNAVASALEKDVATLYKDNETLFIGDSFFQFWRDGTNIKTKFKDTFKDSKVFNIGISASTTHHWRALIDKLVSQTNPKNIILNIGINNVDDENETGLYAAANIQSLMKDLKELFPETKIYYFSITKCSGYFANKWNDHNLSNSLVKKYCEETNDVNYLDIMSIFEKEKINYHQADGLHINDDGYAVFERLIRENVELEKIDN